MARCGAPLGSRRCRKSVRVAGERCWRHRPDNLAIFAEPDPRPCRCCKAPPVAGAVLPDWCDDCNGCDPDGTLGGMGVRFDVNCPRPRRGA